ncbi:glutathione hydrolase 7-like [Copidosoma floridanum]|uniref:glutathione hydrolase 7-like n=1 Tax=Copidosoma floridanum TaxID=29053 RepID=UPI000C6FB095|nr:glutathione hydrolase 7-like [Copidosoma floridanum]
MNYVRQTPTEECPLTKEKKSYSLSDCCGFRSIICSFVFLTAIITAALFVQLTYDENAFQEKLNAHGAVATDYINCSQIGTRILRKGGNAVDAAVASTLCMAVVAPHKTGLGAGGYFMIYSHGDGQKKIVIDFLSNRASDEFAKSNIKIPALMRGLRHAHTLYGKLSWQILVEPAAKLAREGFEVSRDLAYEATKNTNLGIFEHVNAGQILMLPDLAFILEAVSKNGIQDLYLNAAIVEKIFQNKTNLNDAFYTEYANYAPKVVLAEMSTLSNYGIFYPPNVNALKMILNDMNKLNISKENASSIEVEINVAESIIKLIRQYKDYPNTRRYTSVSAVDWQDTYVSVITGLSGPVDLSNMNAAGFAFDSNNDDDKSLKSLTPIFFFDQKVICGLRGVFAADDSIVAAQILYDLLLRSMNVSTAIEYPRYYMLSDGIAMENDDKQLGNKLLYDSLKAVDAVSKADANTIMKSINIIIKRKNLISAHSDSRGHGLASRF